MNGVCVFNIWKESQGFLLQEIRNVKLAGLGLEDVMAEGVVVMVENIPVLPA